MTSFIEEILSGNFEVLNSLVGEKQKCKFTKEILDGTFVALAAPSLEGKTQSAFTFKNVLPLYFALQATEDTHETAQEIYLNYASLNAAIETYARRDLKALFGKESGLTKEQFKNISKSKLRTNGQKFFVLGFLCALVEDAKKDFLTIDEKDRKPWMQYHAERMGKDLSFEAKSIVEFRAKYRHYFDGFCLFLDEFISEPWSVFIRNLARAVGLSCIVANTNGKIANLTGKSNVNFSGVSYTIRRSIWSIVITSLGHISWEVLMKKYPTLKAKLGIIINVLEGNHREDGKLLKAFFYQGKNLEYLRPGLADFLAYAIVNDSLNLVPKYTLAQFMAELTRIMSERMHLRKSNGVKSDKGRAASLGLLFSDAYTVKLNSKSEYLSPSFHDNAFIEEHYYYLINPIDTVKSVFITFANSRTNDKKSTLVLTEDETLKWRSEATYFKQTEFMTILSSFNLLPKDKSFFNIFRIARETSNNSNNDRGASPNVFAGKSDGNRLETFVAASIIDASHHSMESNLNMFEGQQGLVLVNNFVKNLIFTNQDKFGQKISVKIKEKYRNNFDLNGYLGNLIFPFLYPENCEIPEELKEISVQNEKQVDKTRSVLIEKFVRPPDSEQIDGIFACYQKINGSSGRTLKRSKVESIRKRSCVLECKNWTTSVLYGDLEEIILKALGESKKTPEITGTKRQKKKAVENELIKKVALSFIICDKIGKPNPDTLKQFNKFCQENNVNVFKLERNDPNDSRIVIEIVEMLDKLSSEPRNICIVIELATLNEQQS